MIYVVATIEIEENKRDEFLKAFHENIPNVKAEDGCIEYGPAVDIPTDIAVQGPIRDNVVMVVEKWASVDHLKAHNIAPHMTAYREKVKDIVKKVSIKVLEPA
jgi:quinol monooxygenase YgiN